MLLIDEDNPELVELYQLALGLSGINPEFEVTGPAALRRIEGGGKQTPDVVLLDLHLRKEGGVEVNGEELYHKIREVWPNTKIIVVSADIAWCRRFQGVADAVVEKPILSIMDFTRMVQSFLPQAA